jgi:hypothetical protein
LDSLGQDVRVHSQRSSNGNEPLVSALNRVGDCGTVDAFAPTGADASHVREAGVYLTDEVFLYRVVSGADETVELEDCYWLDVVRVPASFVLAGFGS